MSFVDTLAEKYGGSGETFDVVLPKGEKLTFKNLTGYSEIKEFIKKAQGYAKRHLAGRFSPAEKKDLGELVTKDLDLAFAAYLVSTLSVEPKLSVADVLKLSRSAAQVVNFITAEVSNRLFIKSAESEMEEIDDLGEA